jgi:small subunit ribosomal protein S15
MALSPNQTAEILKQHGTHEKDCGSPQAQIALITHRMAYLNEHFKSHVKDHHSKTGLMRLVGQRRRLLEYLHKHDAPAYRKLISDLGIRK